jgi:hypothetical protein
MNALRCSGSLSPQAVNCMTTNNANTGANQRAKFLLWIPTAM